MEVMKKYKVFEDGGGGLTLVVFAQDGETIEYIHTGYEYNPGQLTDDLKALKSGDDPAKDWDGNDLNDADVIDGGKKFCLDVEETDVEFWFPWEQRNVGWKVVADNDGTYPEDMGAAAKIEFGVTDRE